MGEATVPLNTAKVLAWENLRIALRHPLVTLKFAYGGRIGAFAYIVNRVLQKLSATSESEIDFCLRQSLITGTAVLPNCLSTFNESHDLSNLIMLYYLVRTRKPTLVVETGVWTGKSSWAILHALRDNQVAGRLHSIDLGLTYCSGKLPTKEIGGLVPANLRSMWDLRIGDSKELLPELTRELPRIDMFYHDSDHTYQHMQFEFETVWNSIPKGGVLCSDDVHLNSAFADFARSRGVSYFQIEARFGVLYKD